MPALRPRMEILVIRPVEAAEAVPLVRDRVRLDEVHDDPQAHPVRRIDERLQVVRRSEPRRRRKKGRNVIPEAPVVRMLHDRHQLDRVVARPLDPRQHLVTELRIGRDAPFLRGHADVGFVDQR